MALKRLEKVAAEDRALGQEKNFRKVRFAFDIHTRLDDVCFAFRSLPWDWIGVMPVRVNAPGCVHRGSVLLSQVD